MRALIVLAFLCGLAAGQTVSINASSSNLQNSIVNTLDDGFVCMTFDWWGTSKPGWGVEGLLNLNMQDDNLKQLFRRASPEHVRIGGTLSDSIIYLPELDDRQDQCTEGINCLNETRLLEILDFVCNVGNAKLVFSISEEFGRFSNDSANWDSSNAAFFLKYLSQSDFSDCLYGFQLGNELNSVLTSDQVAADYTEFQGLIQQIWTDADVKPLLIGPDPHSWIEFKPDAMSWYDEILAKTTDSLNITGYHMYAMGSGDDSDLAQKFINQSFIRDQITTGASAVVTAVNNNNPRIKIWASETSSANNSGKDKLTNTFLNSFWYAAELGLLALMPPHQQMCRQAFIGGYYELIDQASITPNPDYFLALLWMEVMGPVVLDLNISTDADTEVFTHCFNSLEDVKDGIFSIADCGLGITVINNSPTQKSINLTADGELEDIDVRKEFHLTVDGVSSASDSNSTIDALAARDVKLNGVSLLSLESEGYPLDPTIEPNVDTPINIDPYSIVFVQFQ